MDTEYRSQIDFRKYSENDYEAVCDFLIELNSSDKDHINWNWARFEWMYEHPEFNKNLINSIGLWVCGSRIVGAAIYDMYFGEAFCGALKKYSYLYPEILGYAYRELSDESGIATTICNSSDDDIKTAEKLGFSVIDQSETVMSIKTDGIILSELPDGIQIKELDPAKEPYEFQWLLWQGFDHGDDKAVFEREETIIPQRRRHLDPHLSLAAVNKVGEMISYCCLWYRDGTDYAYVEPVCTIPSYRGKGIAGSLMREGLCRANRLGAKTAFVISDMDFYKKLGFKQEYKFTFYRKENNNEQEKP